MFNTASVLRDICFIAETGNFQMEMTVEQSLRANRYFYPNWDEALAKKLMKVFALPPKAKVKSLIKRDGFSVRNYYRSSKSCADYDF